MHDETAQPLEQFAMSFHFDFPASVRLAGTGVHCTGSNGAAAKPPPKSLSMTQDTETGIWIGVASFLFLTAVATLTFLSPIAFWLLN